MIEEEDYIDADLDSPRDAVERKISRLENEIARVSNMEDGKVLWGAFGLVAFILAFKLPGFNPTIVIVVIPVVVFGGLAYVLYENIRKIKKHPHQAWLEMPGLWIYTAPNKCIGCGLLQAVFKMSGRFKNLGLPSIRRCDEK